jgi:hypothetical protein
LYHFAILCMCKNKNTFIILKTQLKQAKYMKITWKKTLVVLMTLGVVLTGCKKNLEDLFDSEASEDDSSIAATVEDINSQAADVVVSENFGGRTEDESNLSGGRTETARFLSAATVTFNPATRTITFDFGASNVMCADGKNRRGKIIVRMVEGRPLALPYETETTHENYFVNDNKVEGLRRERTISTGTATRQTTITVIDRRVTFTDGRVATRNVNHVRTRTVVSGGFEFTTTGSANGTTRRNRTYNNTIVLPLVSKTSCDNHLFPVQGSINMTVNSFDNPFVVDFGNGTCDKTFTVTYNGRTKTITR